MQQRERHTNESLNSKCYPFSVPLPLRDNKIITQNKTKIIIKKKNREKN